MTLRNAVPFLTFALSAGCSHGEEFIDTRSVAERLTALCPLYPEELLAASDLTPGTSSRQFAVLPGPYAGELGGAATVLTLDGDLSSVPVVRVEFQEERFPDLAARVRSQFTPAEAADLDALEPLEARDYSACDGLARVGTLALGITIDGVPETLEGQFTLFEQLPGSSTTFEAGEAGRFTFALRDGDTLVPEFGEVDGARWDIDSPG